MLKLECINKRFSPTAIWVECDVPNHALRNFKARLVHKVNRTLSRYPEYPYRFPQIGHLRSDAVEFRGKTVLHVHKASLWRQAVRWKSENPTVALVFHAHDVEGFTGGCVLDRVLGDECPSLANQCRHCPVIRPFAKSLTRLGLKSQFQLLHAANPLIIANSQATRRVISASGVIPQTSRLEIVFPATDPAVFFMPKGGIRNQASENKCLKIGYASYSIENSNKGFGDFYRALQILKDNLPVCGYAAGNLKPETKQDYPEVEFVGPLRDESRLREYYQMLDYFVVPSKSEPFGLVSTEAQFCGTPVVCYNVGGLPETILEMVTGTVARQNTPESLADGIIRLNQSGVSLRLDPKSLQVTEFLEQFQVERINQQYAAIYEGLFR
jgi:glycosyltransferase involved in cell wall biosynthesis